MKGEFFKCSPIFQFKYFAQDCIEYKHSDKGNSKDFIQTVRNYALLKYEIPLQLQYFEKINKTTAL